MEIDRKTVDYSALRTGIDHPASASLQHGGSTSDSSLAESIIIIQFKSLKITLSQLRYFTYFFIGIALLWPWNCFLSASGYFIEKFGAGSTLSNNYSSTMMTVSTLTSLIFNSYLSTKQFANLNNRIKLGGFINFLIFSFLAFIELCFSNLHNAFYFTFIMLLVFGSSLGTCLQQNGCMSKVNVLGPKYAQAVMVGQAIAGVSPSISLMFTNLLYDKTEEENTSSISIVLYFATTSLITLISLILSIYTSKFDGETSVILTNDFENDTPKTEYVPFWTLFSKLKYIALSIFTVFLVTLVFAIFASNVTSIHDWGKFSSTSIYIPFIFLIWNIGDLSGRVICAYPGAVLTSDKKLFFYSLTRFLILPFFFLCNLEKYKGKPYINSDLFYIFLQFIFGFTNGHCLSCCFMNVGNYVDDSEKEAAGGFTTIFLSSGLLFGSLFSYLFVFLVN